MLPVFKCVELPDRLDLQDGTPDTGYKFTREYYSPKFCIWTPLIDWLHPHNPDRTIMIVHNKVRELHLIGIPISRETWRIPLWEFLEVCILYTVPKFFYFIIRH